MYLINYVKEYVKYNNELLFTKGLYLNYITY